MTASDSTEKKPFWLEIEEKIAALDPQALSGENLEASIQRIAGELDEAGYNVSHHGGNMLQLRWAAGEAQKVGRPFLEDFNAAVAAFALEDLASPYAATDKLIGGIADKWPELKRAERRADVIRIVEKRKLDLLIEKAKSLPDDKGIRLLIGEKVAPETITGSLGITAEKLKEVNAQIEKERAEEARVQALLQAVAGKSEAEKVRHLFASDVSEKSIIEIARIDPAAIDAVKKAMEEELKEKERLEAEAAARKKAEAAGPSLDAIAPDQMLEYIEAIREILEFSDKEKEIRVMCEQSSIPQALVDIAVSDPDKLDQLEKEAQG